MGDELNERRREIVDHFIERSGLVLSAEVDAAGRIVEANTLFASLLGGAGLIQDTAVLESGDTWADLLAEVVDVTEVTAFAAPTDERMILQVYRHGDRLRILGAHLGDDRLLSRVSADFAAMSFQSRRERRTLQATASKAVAASETDALTGLPNRRRLEDLMADEFASTTPLSAGMVDIDHFKAVNDTHGHAVGDDVIVEVAAVSAAHSRDSDVVARYGGEEFAVLLPGASTAEAIGTAERIRSAIQATVSLPDGAPVTVSIGVAERRDGEALDTLLERADAALYEAKRGGRNRVDAARPSG